MKDSELPSVCKDHPKANIRHRFDTTFVGGGPGRMGEPIHGGDTYECAVCGKRICSPAEYDKRQRAGTHFA